MKNLGELGERLVASWLKTQGYKLLHQGWSCRWGEIDLIATHQCKACLIFVEVKTRGDRNWDSNGLLAIDTRKQEKICQTAMLFLAQNSKLAELPCRFDVALVNYTLAANFDSRVNYLTTSQMTLNGDRYQFNLQTYLKSAFELA
ncbi:YraN family protein [Myxosarcina sp. GI1]|uniref:YraN family protein n=1 Tax=Myxosarcina sp. GI1 TaxID=1541065 RepID=UPI00056028F7|nr:YraN family protein [Myxosarcina sp. GI1]